MKAPLARIIEAASVFAAQQGVATIIEKVKTRTDRIKKLEDRVATLERNYKKE